ncbi:coiled-coil domain-containing protein 178-like isoform X2 [Anneissia japonica]|uniref:coiled-coil domain-containing protein 178-like isoform X2 n=1 Tax=Anneissia japonica TaxID=1529436 RepID=UPI0014255248|nr:coiled-coil domain-containing protein 178-like isoform X2 [Anneissia japonica]
MDQPNSSNSTLKTLVSAGGNTELLEPGDTEVFITESDGVSHLGIQSPDVISITVSSEPPFNNGAVSTSNQKPKYMEAIENESKGEQIGKGDQHAVQPVQKAKDFQIPEGWPRLHEMIFKKRALFFRKPASNSVNRAAENLHKLQERLEEWSKEVELEIFSRKSSVSRASSKVPELVTPRKPTDDRASRRIRFASRSNHCDASSSTSSRTVPDGLSSSLVSVPNEAISRDLSIQGIGAIMMQDAEPVIEEEEVPNIGAEVVIDEVVTLLGRLETDRMDTEKTFYKEKQRVIWLRERIDKLANHRMQELPKAVQNEHEACSLDISELKWHCAYRNRQQNRIQGRVEVSQTLNARLKEDISFVTKHCPLVEEKLELERGAMALIDNAQEQTTIELQKTEAKLKRTQDKSAEAHGKANMERAHIKKELDSVRDALREINLELDEAKALHLTYSHHCNDLRVKIDANKQEKIVLETKNQNAKASEKMTTKKVKKIQEKIVDAEYEHRKLSDDNYTIINKIDETKKKIEKVCEGNEKLEKETLQQLRHMQQRSKELLMENEDIREKLRGSDKQKVANTKNSERIRREFEKVDTQLKVVDEEFEKIKVIHTAMKNKLSGEEDKARLTEDNLQGTSDTLRKQLKEETHSRTVLQARIASDTTDLQKQRVEARKKKAKVSKKATELENAVAVILAEVKELRQMHSEKVQANQRLQAAIANSKKQTLDVNENLKSTIGRLKPNKKKLETENLNKAKHLDHMQYRTDLINNKLDEMEQSAKYMNRVITTTEDVICELAEEMNEISIKLETGQKMQDGLKSSLDDISQQIDDRKTRHGDHMRERHKVLYDLEIQLHGRLTENKKLASEYRAKQQRMYSIKSKLMNHFEDRIKMESSLKDHKQLNGLQTRLHNMLIQYYKIRGMYNENELARFEEISAINSSRILDIKEDMDTCISTISKFLLDQVDGTAAKMVTAAARAVFQDEKPNEAVATH